LKKFLKDNWILLTYAGFVLIMCARISYLERTCKEHPDIFWSALSFQYNKGYRSGYDDGKAGRPPADPIDYVNIKPSEM